MSLTPSHPRYSVDEYLRRERDSVDKHEYRDGEILLMAGSTANHSLITANIIRSVGNALAGKPCHMFDSNLRILIPRKVIYTYPDATVICGAVQYDPRDKSTGSALNPKLIVEVLSPSTEAYDRGEKFDSYREIDSLQEYVLVSQTSPHIQTFLRQKEGMWLFGAFAGMDAVAKLRSLEIEIPLREAYVGVEFPPSAPAPVSERS
jgi:Uma2 family endonuclease